MESIPEGDFLLDQVITSWWGFPFELQVMIESDRSEYLMQHLIPNKNDSNYVTENEQTLHKYFLW